MQFLPGSYVTTIPRWSIEFSDQDQSINIRRLIGSGLPETYDSRDGAANTLARQFVDPTSNEELWWPCDLRQLQIRPKVEVLLKGSIPSYILAGAEARVPSQVSKDGREWKNFGMNSQPLASQWTSFQLAVEQDFRVELFVGQRENFVMGEEKKEEGKEEEEEESNTEWKPLGSSQNCDSAKGADQRKNQAIEGTRNALDLLGNLLANLGESTQFAHGMHILSIPLDQEWYDLPTINHDEKYKLASIGTSGSNAFELLSSEDDLIAMSGSSLLRVDVKSVAAGSESEYIPDVYKPLYHVVK